MNIWGVPIEGFIQSEAFTNAPTFYSKSDMDIAVNLSQVRQLPIERWCIGDIRNADFLGQCLWEPWYFTNSLALYRGGGSESDMDKGSVAPEW